MTEELAKPGESDQPMTLLKRLNTKHPDQADITELRRQMAEKPAEWLRKSRLALDAQQHFLDQIYGKALKRECADFFADQLREELTADTDGPLEALLIEQVVFAWLRLNLTEQLYTVLIKTGARQSFARSEEKQVKSATEKLNPKPWR